MWRFEKRTIGLERSGQVLTAKLLMCVEGWLCCSPQLHLVMEPRASDWARTRSRTLTAAACLCSHARIPLSRMRTVFPVSHPKMTFTSWAISSLLPCTVSIDQYIFSKLWHMLLGHKKCLPKTQPILWKQLISVILYYSGYINVVFLSTAQMDICMKNKLFLNTSCTRKRKLPKKWR